MGNGVWPIGRFGYPYSSYSTGEGDTSAPMLSSVSAQSEQMHYVTVTVEKPESKAIQDYFSGKVPQKGSNIVELVSKLVI